MVTRKLGSLVFLAGWLLGCSSADGVGGTETASTGETALESSSSSGVTSLAGTLGGESGDESSGTGTTSAEEDEDPAAFEDFFARLPGLWVAPVSSTTSAGDFPTMNMDIRVAGETLFSRVDLDGDNSLRFGFEREAPEGVDELVFRNGGEFLGILRDTRTVLEDVSEDRMTWRFCARFGGCGYVDATFEFGVETLRLEADVMGMRHIEWMAMRREGRPTIVADLPSVSVAPDAEFPPLPTLSIDVSWTTPLPEPGDVWVVLSTTPCGVDPAQNCVPSRFIHVTALEGSIHAALSVEQIHPGSYFANVVLDRNRNLIGAGLFPDAGDGVALPDTAATVSDNKDASLDVAIFLNP
ncbi:MAG: hypothetical protein ACRBN8_22715 [Nannocystales bacterium]